MTTASRRKPAKTVHSADVVLRTVVKGHRGMGPLQFGAFVEGVLLEASLLSSSHVAAGVREEYSRAELYGALGERRQVVEYLRAKAKTLSGTSAFFFNILADNIDGGAHLLDEAPANGSEEQR